MSAAAAIASKSSALSTLASPFSEMLVSVQLMDVRQLLHQVMALALIICSALMIWKGLIVYTGSESPVVVVLSGSMEPTFYRGDILFLHHSDRDFEIGDIVVFKIKGKDIPIVHRVHEVHNGPNGKLELLTKGDNNQVHDHWGIYNPGQIWLTREDIMGRATGFLPYFGWVTIGLTDFPIVKYALLGVMGLFVIFAKDS